jgi:DNA-binding protein HU-beta
MTKKDFVKVLADGMSVSQKDAEKAFNGVFDAIANSLLSGEEVSIPKFGKFVPAVQGARTCRNPKTGDTIEVPEKKAIKFKPSKTLKDFVNGVDVSDVESD